MFKPEKISWEYLKRVLYKWNFEIISDNYLKRINNEKNLISMNFYFFYKDPEFFTRQFYKLHIVQIP